MFSCPIIGQFRIFSLILVRAFKCLFSGWSTLSFIEVGISESNTEGCSGSTLFSSKIPGHPFAFQKLFIELKRFLARQLEPVGFRYKPLLPRYLALIFLLSIMYISSWRRWFVSWLPVNAAFPSSVRKVGVEKITLQLGSISVIKDLSVIRLFNIFRDVKQGASFAPAWIIMKLGSLRSNGMTWCFMSSTVAPRKLCNLTTRPFLLNHFCIISFKMESPIMIAVPSQYFPCVSPLLFVAIGSLFLLSEFLSS